MPDDASNREADPEAPTDGTGASVEPEPGSGDESADGTAPDRSPDDSVRDHEPTDGDGDSAADAGGTAGAAPADDETEDGIAADVDAARDDGDATRADGEAGAAVAVEPPASGADDDRQGSIADNEPVPVTGSDDRSTPAGEDDTDTDLDTDPDIADEDRPMPRVPEDVRKYDRFQKMDGAQYDRVNEFLRARTYVTAREWAMARLCADFRTETGVEMTKIGENLPALVPFMTDTYTPQAVNQARASFEEKVRKAGATFLYGAMSDFFTADELDDLMYEVTEVAKFLLEVEGVDLSVEEELEAEERISSVMREVRRSSDALRHDGMECPNCGHEIHAED